MSELSSLITGIRPVYEESPLHPEGEYHHPVLIGYKLVGGWPARVSSHMLRYTDTSPRIGAVINLPPFRVRLIDHDIMTREYIAVPATPSWRLFEVKLAASKRWQVFKARVQATLAVWGLAKWPRGW